MLEKEGDLGRAADLMQIRVDYDSEIGHPNAEKDAAAVTALRARIAEKAVGAQTEVLVAIPARWAGLKDLGPSARRPPTVPVANGSFKT